jgi:hypothetical protein
VRDVEEPGGPPHGSVLADDPPILHRHLPTGELHQLGPGGNMPVVKRTTKERGLGGHEAATSRRTDLLTDRMLGALTVKRGL